MKSVAKVFIINSAVVYGISAFVYANSCYCFWDTFGYISK